MAKAGLRNKYGYNEKMSRKFVLYAAGAILLVAVPLTLYAMRSAEQYSEVRTIVTGVKDFDELSSRFASLATSKGAQYAYRVLAEAQLPPNTDLHLLGHTVGEELYKQQGVAGIAVCTQDFRNACSHAVVVGALNEFGGTKALGLIKDACSKAPGGSGAYTMCYHGLGHGVFAYFGYDLSKTVEFCRLTGTPEYNQREYQECVGGSIMELMGGGGHDRDLWLLAREKYYQDTDPLSPCSSSVIPADAKGICYVYISPHLFAHAGADLSVPGPDDFANAFTYCDRISSKTPDLRSACFGGIGKEFPVLALARDIRAIAQASDEQLTQMRQWCNVAPNEEAYNACTQSVLASLHWGGENDPRVSIRFCDLAPGGERSACFAALYKEAAYYAKGKDSNAARMCSLSPEEFQVSCRAALSL